MTAPPGGPDPYAPPQRVQTAWSYGAGSTPAYAPNQPVPDARTRPSARRTIRTWVLTGLVVVGMSVLALALAAYYGAALGPTTALLGLLVAIIPLGIVIPTFLWLDRYEAEPARYLVFAFCWGAVVAAGFALVFNTTALQIFRASTDQDSAIATTAVLVAPFIEEGLKGVLVLFVWWFRRREFDGVVDGMVYAGICAAGFAFTENISYLGQAYSGGGGAMLGATFVVRCLMSPFAHPIFTVLTGIGIGIAATSRRGPIRLIAPVVGYLLAVAAHAIWNLAAVAGGQGMVAIYLLVEVPIFVAFIVLVVWARRREGRTIGQFLGPYAQAGWLSPAEVAMLSSMPRRREARIWARTNAGRSGLAAMRAFQDSASELALLRRRMYHSAADATALATERQLLDTMVARRREFIGMPLA